MRPAHHMTNARSRRRGVTLLEMLVTVALLLLMMITIVAIFQAATGAVSVSRAYTLLDQDLRRLDVTLRQDLDGVTCKMTPPNNPANGLGYFEYSENALSDAQDEDSDDTLRFTAKAPDGRPFTGRMWVPKRVPPPNPPTTPGDPAYNTTRAVTFDPVPVTSQYAEIIYFLRGDKLYRRVRLILPAKFQAIGNTPSDPPMPGDPAVAGDPPIRPGAGRIGFATNLFEPFALFIQPPPPAPQKPALVTVGGFPFVSWQGLNDVSARPSEYPANVLPANLTANGYVPIPNTLGDLTERHYRFASPRFADDFRNNAAPGTVNPDGVADDVDGNGVVDYYPTMYSNSKAAGLLNDGFAADGSFGMLTSARPLTQDLTAFPYLYRNAYSKGIQGTVGTIHTLDPTGTTHNHNPLLVGDSIAVPALPAGAQTWWGFPTWRETMAPTWLDPIKRINDPAGAPFFSDSIASTLGETAYQQFKGLSFMGTSYALPPQPDQPFSDGLPSGAATSPNAFDLGQAPVFEDDLIATNVRSFNIKAFDGNPRYISTATKTPSIVPLLPGYYDLGYIAGIDPATGSFSPLYASGNSLAPTISATNPYLLDTLGHEGRMPPLTTDNRFDVQYPTYVNAAGTLVPTNLGDNTTTVTRMRRIWDSWSTTYSAAPALPIDPTQGPLNGLQPVVPSYPAPYTAPLRGIEIQIRLTDPESKHVKTLTIHQDFSDKL
ncbi:MAG: hypothetical protein JWN86_686 [Planctomycetota bacterium]|nr:hypothetical protein [Planctomycetota bacterium]